MCLLDCESEFWDITKFVWVGYTLCVFLDTEDQMLEGLLRQRGVRTGPAAMIAKQVLGLPFDT